MSASALQEVYARGRQDLEFFWQVALGLTPHPGQLRFHEEAQATVNALATANRWGKTMLLPAMHYHSLIYKVGAEPFYLDEKGRVDRDAWMRTTYNTAHTGKDWEVAKLVWLEAHRLLKDSEFLQAFVADAPKSLPPHIDFRNGARWKFRTLGDDASTIDGDSYYLVSVDEAGWIKNLEEMMSNVIRVRVADVSGRIVICGTFKPGVSVDFYKLCVRAAAATGEKIAFDYRESTEDEIVLGGLHPTIQRYLKEAGIEWE